jgi:nucleoside-diphosphate-sugar epimerase
MAAEGLTVAVTGPTGDLGVAVVNALHRSPRVKRIIGMARSPFDPAEEGWRKVEYRQGDVQDRASVKDAVKGADAVVHLAFAILTAGESTRSINVDGSRTVFEEAAKAGAERICYASSVAAYGFHDDNPDWLDESIPARGTPEHPYSAQKAEVESILADVLARRRHTGAWIFRPPIVAGPRAQTLIEEMPYVRLSDRMPGPVVRLIASMPALKPVLPDPGTRFQLIHHDDVAQAFLAGVLGRGEPGAYNIAAKDTLRVADVANALGWYSIPVPELAVDVTAEVVARVPGIPSVVSWIQAVRKPVLLKTDRARTKLRWRPQYSSRRTLRALVDAWRSDERPMH